MSDRSHRLFEIIQRLRAASAPVTARDLAAEMEVATRTIYRDVVTLQASGVPIEGAAGMGYVIRSGYDLPPLNFSQDEIEAITVGLSLIGRTADVGLMAAARQATDKIRAAMPEVPKRPDAALFVSHWSAVPKAGADYRLLRRCIRSERKLALHYTDEAGRQSERVVCPLALVYYVDSAVLAAWCELRNDYRHFRVDRISRCAAYAENFTGRGKALREAWQALRQPFGGQPVGSIEERPE